VTSNTQYERHIITGSATPELEIAVNSSTLYSDMSSLRMPYSSPSRPNKTITKSHHIEQRQDSQLTIPNSPDLQCPTGYFIANLPNSSEYFAASKFPVTWEEMYIPQSTDVETNSSDLSLLGTVEFPPGSALSSQPYGSNSADVSRPRTAISSHLNIRNILKEDTNANAVSAGGASSDCGSTTSSFRHSSRRTNNPDETDELGILASGSPSSNVCIQSVTTSIGRPTSRNKTLTSLKAYSAVPFVLDGAAESSTEQRSSRQVDTTAFKFQSSAGPAESQSRSSRRDAALPLSVVTSLANTRHNSNLSSHRPSSRQTRPVGNRNLYVQSYKYVDTARFSPIPEEELDELNFTVADKSMDSFPMTSSVQLSAIQSKAVGNIPSETTSSVVTPEAGSLARILVEPTVEPMLTGARPEDGTRADVQQQAVGDGDRPSNGTRVIGAPAIVDNTPVRS